MEEKKSKNLNKPHFQAKNTPSYEANIICFYACDLAGIAMLRIEVIFYYIKVVLAET